MEFPSTNTNENTNPGNFYSTTVACVLRALKKKQVPLYLEHAQQQPSKQYFMIIPLWCFFFFGSSVFLTMKILGYAVENVCISNDRYILHYALPLCYFFLEQKRK